MSGEPELNPFAAELVRAAAVAAAPDKAPSRRELARISGLGKTAVADWLAGKTLPRSWDDGAVLLVDAIIKFAARYGKHFPDEEAVRQRCKDAYYCAKGAQRANGEDFSQRPDDNVPDPVGSTPESKRFAFLAGGWSAKRAVSVAAVVAVLTIAATLTLGWSPVEWRKPASPAAVLPIGVPLYPTPLVSAKSAKCVVVDGNADEARAFQSDCTGMPGSLWYLRPAVGEHSVSHLFHIVNASNGKCLSPSEEMHGGAHVVVQRACLTGSGKGQLWNFVPGGGLGDGWTHGVFVNMQSSLLLDINGENVEDGAPVIEWWENGKQNQRFRVKDEVVG